ncbi:MAG: hypothetical protein ABA06_01965 [Parcubacteria bacterium C7867-001]|nr:MAG: hypothetical protein ABA06_01965 [Parcubacteria bacterium C7867-001]
MDELLTRSDVSDPASRPPEPMHEKLTRAVSEGKETMPESVDPLVCKPKKLESWRIFKIMSEFVEGFELVQKYALAASFFGTTRGTFEPHFYESATKLAELLSKKGFAIVTGGASGIMEAANKGAHIAGGASIGLNIELPNEQRGNNYLTDNIFFNHFFVRKTMLSFASEVYIYFPGGFGTLDEFFEMITLIQTKKIKRVPMVLFGSEYWNPLIEFFKTKLLAEHQAIDAEDMNLFFLTDSVDEAYEYIINNVKC